MLQYKLKGQDKVAKGGIYVVEDGSGSMWGDREVWAKAVSLALMHIARAQGRKFMGIHFSSPGEMKSFDFDTKTGEADTIYGKKKEHLDPLEAVLQWAEIFFGGGTELMGPMSLTLDQLEKEFAEEGAVKGDIVVITDGEVGVSSDWMEKFKERQEALGFKVWAFAILTPRNTEPLFTLADGKVTTITDLFSGNEVTETFREL